jgi:hypothetical protein
MRRRSVRLQIDESATERQEHARDKRADYLE